MSTNELTNKVRELKELAAEITSLEDEIKATMTERGVDELTVDIFKIRWQTITSSRFDTTSFKKAMPELYGQFTKTSESRRFSIA